MLVWASRLPNAREPDFADGTSLNPGNCEYRNGLEIGVNRRKSTPNFSACEPAGSATLSTTLNWR